MQFVVPPAAFLFRGILRRPTRTVDKLRHAHTQAILRLMPLAGWCLMIGRFLLSPILLAMTILPAWRKASARVQAHMGKSRIRQLLELLSLAITRGVPAYAYYAFELYAPDNRARIDDYLYRYETKHGPFRFLREMSKPAMALEIHHKRKVAEIAEAHGLRAAGVLADVGPEGLRFSVALPAWGNCDLFVKPARLKGGRGAQIWRRENGAYLGPANERLSVAELVKHLQRECMKPEYAKGGGFIIQRRLVNHPDLSDLSAGALCTFRVVTMLDDQDAPKAYFAVLRMPSRAGSAIDNFHAGGIASPVDLETGILGRASDYGTEPQSAWHARHPVTGAQIEGRRLLFVTQIVELAEAAHRIWGYLAVAGWDIALLPEGPCLIEANSAPDLDIVQRALRAPIGDSEFTRTLIHRLERANYSELSIPEKLRIVLSV